MICQVRTFLEMVEYFLFDPSYHQQNARHTFVLSDDNFFYFVHLQITSETYRISIYVASRFSEFSFTKWHSNNVGKNWFHRGTKRPIWKFNNHVKRFSLHSVGGENGKFSSLVYTGLFIDLLYEIVEIVMKWSEAGYQLRAARPKYFFFVSFKCHLWRYIPKNPNVRILT